MKKKFLTYLCCVVFFLVLAYAFVPQVLGGKIVNQSDISGYVGMSHEMSEWNDAHPSDPAEWTGSMFGGMPTTMISAPRQGDFTQPIYDLLLVGKRPATYLFISLLGAFLLMLSLGVDWILAVGGAIAVTFCAYNLQIIQVGHNTKMQAIAFLPWVLAGVIYSYKSIYKDKYLLRALLGATLFAFALSFQIKANHQQITYYLAIMILLYAAVLFVWLVSSKDRRSLVGRFFAVSALLLVIGFAGIATNANKLIPIYKYTPYSMRGGSELADKGEGSAGLDIDYATAWSYGWEELPNLMIPNFNGGSSAGSVNPSKSETYDLLKRAGQSNLNEVCRNLPLYWGPQPFTAGPMYMGAIVVFLFVLGLGLCGGKEKWWLVICTVLAVFLAVGSHWLWFTRLWYDHVPFYNKFRTVSMALVVLQVTLPVLGFLTLDKIMKGGVGKDEFRKSNITALAVTAGFCLLCWCFPGIAGGFTGGSDSSMSDVLVDALVSDRITIFRSDALRSFLLIAAASVLLWWGYRDKNEGSPRLRTASLLICLLVLVDMFSVGKRYLSGSDFVSPRDFKSQFAKRPVDEAILEDKAPSYRVLDLTVNVFNDSHPSYWHKNIGGYSPAKLQRYQDVIERYLTAEINSIYKAAGDVATLQELEDRMPSIPVLSALNCKYIILGEDIPPLVNGQAFGNAWFVSSEPSTGTPQEQIAALGDVDKDVLDDELYKIEMTSYTPDELHYRYSIPQEATALFSEVWYPDGWHASLEDGSDVEVFGADWILRAARLPAGDHELVMKFDSQSVGIGRSISLVSSVFLIILLISTVIWMFVQKRRSVSIS